MNIEEKEEILSLGNGVGGGGGKQSKRAKRKINAHQGGNYRANGLDRDGYTPKLCYNNYPDSERECKKKKKKFNINLINKAGLFDY